MVRARSGAITQLAVAEVLARRLWSYPRVPGDVDVLPHQLKDTVSRALSGRLLSRSTLALFIDAFGFIRRRGRPALAALGGLGHDQRAVRPARGDAAHRAGTARGHRPAPSPDAVLARPRPRSARTACWPGPAPCRSSRPSPDGLDRIPYLYDTKALTLEVGQGCTELSGELYQVSTSCSSPTSRWPAPWTWARPPRWSTGPRTSTRGTRTTRMSASTGARSWGGWRTSTCASSSTPSRLPAGVWWARWDGVEGR